MVSLAISTLFTLSIIVAFLYIVLLHFVFYKKYKYKGFNHYYITFQRVFLLALIPWLLQISKTTNSFGALPLLLLNLCLLIFDSHLLNKCVKKDVTLDNIFPDLDITSKSISASVLYFLFCLGYIVYILMSVKVLTAVTLIKILLSLILGCFGMSLWGQTSKWGILSRLLPGTSLLMILGYSSIPRFDPINLFSYALYCCLLMSYIVFLFTKKKLLVLAH